MTNLPPLNTIRMFDAAARHLNFRLAADELNLTQGAVAQQVRRLEAALGVALFHRKARGLALTEAGRTFRAPVRRAMAILEDATRQLHPEHERITISVSPSFATKWLVPRLKSFSQAHPEIDVRVMASEALADFQSDGVDIAVRQGRPPFGPGLRADHLCGLELCAVCCPGFLEGEGEVTAVEDLASYPLLHDTHGLWHTLLDERTGQKPQQTLQFSQTALAIDAAAAGQGIALAPAILVATDIEAGRLTCVWRDTAPEDAGFYYVTLQEPRNLGPLNAMRSWLFDRIRTDA